MKWLMILTCLVGGLCAIEVQAAAQPSAPYATGKICWPWTKGAPRMTPMPTS